MTTQQQPTLEILVLPDKSTFAAAGGRTDAVLKNASDALSKLGDALKNATSNFMKSLEEAAPDEVQLELNLTMETEGRWLIIAGKAGATVGVTLTWKRTEN